MLKGYLEGNSIENKVEKFISDYETGILSAIKKIWPNITLQGCRFHFGQAIQRWVDANMRESMKSPEMETLFQCILALPMINLNDLEAAMRYLEYYEFSNLIIFSFQ